MVLLLLLGCDAQPSTTDASTSTDASRDGASPATDLGVDATLSDAGLVGCAAPIGGATVLDVTEAPYAAHGDGTTDDTDAIQAALDAAASGDVVRVPDGVFMIDATRGLRPHSATTLALTPGAILRAITTTSANYDVVRIQDAHDVTIVGGTIEGERARHDPSLGGEWGMGLSIHASQRIIVDGVTARDCWGDGFYVTGSSTDVTMCNALADGNRRQGMSITSVARMDVTGCTFRGTHGTLPEDGVDIEPNAGETVSDVTFTRCTFEGNAGFGLEIGVPIAQTGNAFVTRVLATDCDAFGNGVGTMSSSPRAGITVSNCRGTGITGCRSHDNTGDGIYLRNDASGSRVTGNTCSHNGGSGIVEYLCMDNTITGDTCQDNGAHGVYSTDCTGSTISGNTESGNTIPP